MTLYIYHSFFNCQLSAAGPASQVGEHLWESAWGKWRGRVWCICLGWHAAVAGMLLQSQLQVIGSSVLMSIYLSCGEAGAAPCCCLHALAEYSLDQTASRRTIRLNLHYIQDSNTLQL